MARGRGPGNDDPSSGGPDDADFARFVADAKAELAASARTRERWLRAQATESATFAGVAWDLAELGSTVTVTTAAGRQLSGALVGVGADFLSLSAKAGPAAPTTLTFVALHAVGTLRAPDRGLLAGDRSLPSGADAITLQEALAALTAERPRLVARSLLGEQLVAGELRGVGIDVAVIGVGTRAAEVVYLRLSSAAELSVMVSG